MKTTLITIIVSLCLRFQVTDQSPALYVKRADINLETGNKPEDASQVIKGTFPKEYFDDMQKNQSLALFVVQRPQVLQEIRYYTPTSLQQSQVHSPRPLRNSGGYDYFGKSGVVKSNHFVNGVSSWIHPFRSVPITSDRFYESLNALDADIPGFGQRSFDVIPWIPRTAERSNELGRMHDKFPRSAKIQMEMGDRYSILFCRSKPLTIILNSTG